jgi:hypothetical protein
MVLEATMLHRRRPEAMLGDCGAVAGELRGNAGPIWDLVRAP